MRRLVAVTLVLGLLVAAGAVKASELPRVYIGYPNPAPCEQTVETHGKYVEHRVACYQVRPSSISVSEDGNGFLSDLTWSAWNSTSARGSGLESVRCVGVPKVQKQDPNCGVYRCSNSAGTTFCEPGKMSYSVPAAIRLGVTVSTKNGVDFTELRVSSSHRTAVCLPPADSC